MTQDSDNKAKAYQRQKQVISLVHLALTPLLLFLIASWPVSSLFKAAAEDISELVYVQLAVYFLLFSILMLILDFPLSVYSGHVLEHKYELSNQNFPGWLWMFSKKSILSFLLSLALVEGLYALIYNFSEIWWFLAWLSYAAVSYFLGKIFPTFIVPLFYRYGEVDNQELKERIFKLVGKFNLPLKNVYSLNLSKTTKKANAAFMGIGKSKRVVLSDTLLENFTNDEIETVVAHELGHYQHRDIWKHLGFGMSASFILFYLAFRLLGPLNQMFGYQGVEDIAGLPVLFLLFYGFGLLLMPLQNGFSRWMERGADRFALQLCPDTVIFISCMEKLGKINLADPKPHPVYEWLFYDHPAIHRRIAMAKSQ